MAALQTVGAIVGLVLLVVYVIIPFVVWSACDRIKSIDNELTGLSRHLTEMQETLNAIRDTLGRIAAQRDDADSSKPAE